MVDDDEVDDETSHDPTLSTPAPRRATFTPHPASPQRPSSDDAVHDDDELANALAAELNRFATGTISVVNPEQAEQDETPFASPPPLVAPPESAPHGELPWSSAPPESTEPPSSAAPPAWISAPAPDPSQAVPLPEGPPQPPVRQSLPDEQLLEWVDDAGQQPGGTLNVIEQLESQLRLREEEARAFRAWEHRMRSLGTPDALDAVEQARPDFTGVLPKGTDPPDVSTPIAPETGSFFVPEAPVADWPAPQFDDEAPEAAAVPVYEIPVYEPEAVYEPEPEPEPEQELQPEAAYGPESEPEPEPEQPESEQSEPEAEPETWSPESADPVYEIPVYEPGAVYEPAPVYEPEPEPEPEPEQEQETASEPEAAYEPEPELAADESEPEPPVVEAPPPALPAWDVPAPSATWAPGPDYSVDEPVNEPEAVTPATGVEEPELEPEPEPEPEIVIEAEPEAEHVPPAWSPFAPPPLVEPAPAQAFSFDTLLNGRQEEPLRPDPEPATEVDAAPEVLFIEPLPLAAGELIPSDTGSVTITSRAYEEELLDDVDETDRASDGSIGPVAVDPSGIAVVAPPMPPSGPISTVRVPEDEVVLADNQPVRQPVFSLEESGLEPTPLDHRAGRAARMFWLWFAANSSILSLGLGAAVFAVGMSLRQSIIAVLAGIALSFIPLGLTTLAGKRSGQPTMVVSRATFGLIGNVVPAVLALVTRLFWGAVLLWLLASSVAIILVGAQLDGSLGERQLLLISLALAFLIALLVAFAGYPLVARIQLILSIVSGVLVVGLIAMTAQYIDLPEALTTPDGPWLLTITGAVLVFSFVGLVWATSGADLARYQRVDSSGASSMLWATFGTTLPTFLLIGYGALLAASDKGIASGFVLSPLDTLALMLPSWYPVPLLAATALSLLSGITLTLYSGGFALQSIGVRLQRQWSIVIVGALLGGLALLLTFGVTGGINELFRDLATTLAVPTAAWAGIFAAETMIRNRRFESQSLLTRGGVYPDVRWSNLIGLVLISVIGFALTTATVSWLSWQGYGFTLLGIPLDTDLAGTDLGVLVALVLGLLTPIATGIPAIRRQEATVV